MKLPNITIIIANYNYAKYVGQAIDSAVNQDYEGSINVCVINDGSSDDSWDIISSRIPDRVEIPDWHLLPTYYRYLTTHRDKAPSIYQSVISENRIVTAINQENMGASIARNVGIDLCMEHTDAFCILDADDEATVDRVSVFVSKWLENPKETGVVYGDYDILDVSNGRMVREFKQPFNREVLMKECIVHSNALISKSALLAVREEDGEYYDSELHGPASQGFIGSVEDYDLWIRISEKFVICHVPKSLSLVRVTGKNQSLNMNMEVYNKNWQVIMSKLQKRNVV
jgi:glycosyltransferase involved in cell wall biosynthesis